MEMILKITDCNSDALTCLSEVSKLLEEAEKKNKVLIDKGRSKIDIVGECCNVEIKIIQDTKQLSTNLQS